ncbi:nucleoside-diphosphate sugar epimerase/dehydratase [Xinfangfangia sp. CPCC 101601]|uniref:Nucleoside-diphosphate sugar epimerase/dehydratase n=1 Tax=Pseudogemmobacter lacusdianii TaxID=3069608 RepID=A0ABU0VTT5_9RHOB|nr:nucleoside-diphosphate sugar epimerase/dehydratase [Xinfangfangia sp. CPCC 101601]MDQ2065142.1 nucleoside-diphosphate sugar epimerase/dehydratase [Xinfangfangia sp. CPCC 101601]
MLADALSVPFCFLLTTLLVYGSIWPETQIERLAILFPALTMLGALASLAAGLPRIKLKTYSSFSARGILPFAVMVGLGALCLTLLPQMHFPLLGIITFVMMVFLCAIFVRVGMLRIFLWVLATDQPQLRVVIYGAGRTGQQLASALQSHETISVVAFVDDNPALHVQSLMGRRIYPPQELARLVRQFDIQRVLLAMPSMSAPKQAQISRRLQALGLSVQALPSFAQLIGSEALVEQLTNVPNGQFLGRSHLDDVLASASNAYRAASVMITGAGGSVGAELCRQVLLHRPRRLVLYEVSELALYTIERDLRELLEAAGQADQVTLVPVLGTVADGRLTRAVLAQHEVEIVFHAAAYKHVPLVEQNPVAGIANNVFGTRVLAEACSEIGVRRCILISTDKAVRPSNVMGASKRLAELVIQDRAKRSAGTHFAIVRFGNVLGSSGSVIPLFREQIAKGGPITLTHDEVTRYFMTIAEAAQLVLMAGSFVEDGGQGAEDGMGAEVSASAATSANVFVLDMGEPVRIRKLAEQMIQGAGCSLRDAANPDGDIEIKIIGLRPGEKLHEELLIGQGLLTTPHPKVLRATEECLSELEMANAMQELTRMMVQGDVEAMRALAMQLVQPKNAVAATMSFAT